MRKAIALGPESSDTLGLVASGLARLGQHTEAVRVADQAIALAPHHASLIDFVKGLALFHLERFPEALEGILAARSDGWAFSYVTAYAAAAHAALGHDEKARPEVGKLLDVEPGFRLETWPQYTVLRLAQDRDRLKRHLLRAGAPA